MTGRDRSISLHSDPAGPGSQQGGRVRLRLMGWGRSFDLETRHAKDTDGVPWGVVSGGRGGSLPPGSAGARTFQLSMRRDMRSAARGDTL